MHDALLTVSGVSLDLQGLAVLTDVSLAIQAGRIVTIVGPNGAGKSTLLKVALGLIKPDRGVVFRRSWLKVGYVPQSLTIDPALPMSVWRFLTLAVPSLLCQQAVDILSLAGAAALLDSQLGHLSGGQLQRVLIARAVLAQPDLLVLDEPVGGVDMTGQAHLYDLIGSLARDQGMGVLMVSHDLHVVMAATDEVICLNRHVCCAGHPEAVSIHPEYLALFGPRVAGSLAVYTHVHDHVHGGDGQVVPGADDHLDHKDCCHG